MMDAFLRKRLDRVVRRGRWLALWRVLAVCWASAAAIGAAVVGLERADRWAFPGTLPLLVVVATGTAAALAVWLWLRSPDYLGVSRRIEKANPELDGVLLTAVEQPVDDRAPDFLRQRVQREAIRKCQEQDWRTAFPTGRFVLAQVVHAAALVCFVAMAVALYRLEHQRPAGSPRLLAAGANVAVDPGDVMLEKGETLVVLARFGRRVPANVSMTIQENGAAPRVIPLVRSLSDPVFGGSVLDVQQGFTYRLEYGAGRTRDFVVTVFEHPRLVRADATLTFPGYTRLGSRRIEDTTRVSAVEGTRVDLVMQLNKPVRSAQLIPRGEAGQAILAEPEPHRPGAVLRDWIPARSGTYDLVLVDSDGRKNKAASAFMVEVQPNRPPQIDLATPRGDLRPSSLEEVVFEGTVWDDFGALAYGMAYTTGDGAEKVVELGRGAPAREKRPFRTVLELEELGVKPDALLSWHMWADDIGPDGEVRRTSGDLFFAEVRPFDEVFRESQMAGSSEPQQGEQGGDGTRRLAELQKQIISATWNLQRNGKPSRKDIEVVRDAQQQVLEQARQAAEQVRSPRDRGTWAGATSEMERAAERLEAAASSSGQLAQALPPERAAYQTLLKLQARETSVTRGQRGGGSGRGQASQRQLDQLDLQQAENRYETQRQARAPRSEQRSEQAGVMNRLQDLARRQQDLNARLQELKVSLQAARDEQEREELRRRLKRLEEEQRRMLADADELRQRMDAPRNQADMSGQRQQLDQARDDLKRAADAAGQGSVAQAVASGTRAQRQLQQARDDLRRQSSSEFSEELRDIRAEAREVERQQQEIERRLAGTEGRGRQKSLSGAEADSLLAQQVSEQKQRWSRLIERARQVSEQAENSEPLVSKQLYESVRKASQADDASVAELQRDLLGRGELTYSLRDRLQQTAAGTEPGKALQAAGEMLREGNLAAAGESARRAGAQAGEFRRGVERAAESVLGDEAEQLRLARSELEELTRQVESEIAADSPGRPADPAAQDERPLSPPGGTGGSDPRQAGSRGAGNDRIPQDPSKAERAVRPDSTRGESGQGTGRLSQANQNRRGLGDSERRSIDELLRGAAEGAVGEEDAGGGGGGATGAGPLTSRAFGPWTERLRDVEQLLDSGELRAAVAAARERAREIRRDHAQSRRKPDWAVVQLQVVRPLVEVRNRVADELSRLESRDSLAPIDHDPVPGRFAESVRRYYEELGRGRTLPAPSQRPN